jgi:hypothetical protein
MISWQEKSGNTVVHVEDFKEHRLVPLILIDVNIPR